MSKNKPHIIVYTDGACKGNPGKGGWGAVLKFGQLEKHLKGGEQLTTNNRMEITAVIEALKALNMDCEIDIYTDSQYVQKGVTGLKVGKSVGGKPPQKIQSKTPIYGRF